MMNIQNVRTMPAGHEAPNGPLPLQPVAPAQVVTAVATDAMLFRRAAEGEVDSFRLPADASGRPSAGSASAEEFAGRPSMLQLSSAAAFLDELLRLPGGEPIRAASALTTGAMDVPALARALRQSIQRSGLFHESHLAQRAPGDPLLQEPQAQWPRQEAAEARAPAAERAPEPAATLPPAAQALVRQQIDVLESGLVRWQGEPWPGQEARIEIREDEPGRAPGAPSTWSTRLAMELPGLGKVNAILTLRGSEIGLSIETGGSISNDLLRAALPQLALALEARSLKLGAAAIRHG